MYEKISEWKEWYIRQNCLPVAKNEAYLWEFRNSNRFDKCKLFWITWTYNQSFYHICHWQLTFEFKLKKKGAHIILEHIYKGKNTALIWVANDTYEIR